MDLLAGKFILILVCHLMMTFDFWLLDCKINSSVFQDLVIVASNSVLELSFLPPNFLRVIEHLLLTWQMGSKTLLIPSKEVICSKRRNTDAHQHMCGLCSWMFFTWLLKGWQSASVYDLCFGWNIHERF